MGTSHLILSCYVIVQLRTNKDNKSNISATDHFFCDLTSDSCSACWNTSKNMSPKLYHMPSFASHLVSKISLWLYNKYDVHSGNIWGCVYLCIKCVDIFFIWRNWMATCHRLQYIPNFALSHVVHIKYSNPNKELSFFLRIKLQIYGKNFSTFWEHLCCYLINKASWQLSVTDDASPLNSNMCSREFITASGTHSISEWCKEVHDWTFLNDTNMMKFAKLGDFLLLHQHLTSTPQLNTKKKHPLEARYQAFPLVK